MKNAGIEEVILTVGHLAELLRAFFQDGERFGLPIVYSYEDEPLGTAGPLSLVAERLDGTFLVTNGDVLTTLDIRELAHAHQQSGAVATIAYHPRQVNVNLGVLQFNSSDELTNYIEKPTYDLFVSMGVYVFEPRVLDYIPHNQYLDFPDLVLKLIDAGETVKGYRYDGYWQDLGRQDDYEMAVQEFDSLKPQLLGEGN